MSDKGREKKREKREGDIDGKGRGEKENKRGREGRR